MLRNYIKTILFSIFLLVSTVQAQKNELASVDNVRACNSSSDSSSSSSSSSSSDSDSDSSSSSSSDSDSDNSDCNSLKLKHLTAGKIKAHCLSSKSITAKNICSHSVDTKTLCADRVNVKHRFCAPDIRAAELCVGNLQAANLCANAILANQFEQCGVFRATAVFAAPTLYTLGTPLNFDTILDDPNGNMAFGPTRYIAPRSGYYLVTVELDQSNLVTTPAVLGIPVSDLIILVNGVPFRQDFSPYLSFHDAQTCTTSALLSLKAGDTVSVQYDVFQLSDGVGFGPIAGTVLMAGNGTEANETVFKIHLLSNDCPPALCGSTCNTMCHPTECGPCTPVHDHCK